MNQAKFLFEKHVDKLIQNYGKPFTKKMINDILSTKFEKPSSERVSERSMKFTKYELNY